MRFSVLLVASLALLATAAEAKGDVPCEYTVEKRDSLYKISKKFDLELEAVIAANPDIADPDVIDVDQIINLPCNGGAPAPAPEPPAASLAALLAADPDFSTLAAVATAAGFEETLSDPELVATVFAPNNRAFERLLAALDVTAEELLTDKALLARVLSYHVVGGVAAKAADLTNGQELPTLLAGQSLTVELRKSGPRLRTTSDQVVQVIAADIPAGAAIVHVVRDVLLPAPEPTPVPAPAPAPSSGTAPAPSSGTGCSHVVEAGEFLYQIAEDNNTTVEELLKLNPEISDANLILPGDEIELPC